SLETQFAGEPGRDEIILDIESRMAELFAIKLESGAQAIDGSDVQKVIATLGHATELNDTPPAGEKRTYHQYNVNQGLYESSQRRLFRNPNDKMLGGVCSGIANYFDI